MKETTRATAKMMEELVNRLERMHLPEYMEYMSNRRRLLGTQFLMGMARGLGMAVGFTILGAMLVLMLQRLAERNLPVIGDFLVKLVSFVQNRLE